MSDELKPCPHCGGQAKYQQIPGESMNPNAGGCFIECSQCQASTNLLFPLKDDVRCELTERWNRRAALPAPVEPAPDGQTAINMAAAGLRALVNSLQDTRLGVIAAANENITTLEYHALLSRPAAQDAVMVPREKLEQVRMWLETAGEVGVEVKFDDGTQTPNSRLILQLAGEIQGLLAAALSGRTQGVTNADV